LSSEYELLLKQLLQERRSRLEKLTSEKGEQKQIDQLLSEIRFVQAELERYDRGLTIFRSKSVPKVGRWGKPEEEEHAHRA
jgi:hypothetical protein